MRHLYRSCWEDLTYDYVIDMADHGYPLRPLIRADTAACFVIAESVHSDCPMPVVITRS